MKRAVELGDGLLITNVHNLRGPLLENIQVSRLGLTVGSARRHIHTMHRKLHVQNRVEAVNKYFGR